MITKAKEFAKMAHMSINQRRKYTNEEYHLHPYAVADILLEHSKPSTAMVCAAHLHDVVEDTPFTFQDIFEIFGLEVAELVYDLTNCTTKEDGNRAQRKEIELERLSKISPKAMMIKMADIFDNVSSIAKYDKDFAKVYIKEKQAILEVFELTVWQTGLFYKCINLLSSIQKELNEASPVI